MNEEREQKKQVKHGIVILLLNAQYVQWVDCIDSVLLGQLVTLLVPWIEVKLEYVLHDN